MRFGRDCVERGRRCPNADLGKSPWLSAAPPRLLNLLLTAQKKKKGGGNKTCCPLLWGLGAGLLSFLKCLYPFVPFLRSLSTGRLSHFGSWVVFRKLRRQTRFYEIHMNVLL